MAMLLIALATSLVSGCDSLGPSTPGVEGYWKGQMVEETTGDQRKALDARNDRRPRRILMRLQQEDEIVQGVFAQSSDVIAFRQIEDAGARRVSTHPVAGALDGRQLRISFPGEAGRTVEVEATVSAKMIVGRYIATSSAVDSRPDATTSGTFEIERF